MRPWISKSLKWYRYQICACLLRPFLRPPSSLPILPKEGLGSRFGVAFFVLVRFVLFFYPWTFILANLATDVLLPDAFVMKSQLRLPTESSLHKFLNLCFAISASHSLWAWRKLLLAIPEPKMNWKSITAFKLARQWRRNSHQAQLSEQLLWQGDIAKESQNRSQGKYSPCKGSAVFCSLQLESNCNLNPEHKTHSIFQF